MVNQNFEKFRQVQKKHQAEYIGTDRRQPPGQNDADFNNQSDTDKAPGATGRKD